MNAQEWVTKKGYGGSAALCKLSGMNPPAMCKKLRFKASWTLEDAVMLDKATNGEIRAEEVCPAFAEHIAHLRGVAA